MLYRPGCRNFVVMRHVHVLFYEITAGEDKEHFMCKFSIIKLTTAVFSYTEKSSQKLVRDSIRMHRESQKKICLRRTRQRLLRERRLNFRDPIYFH